MINKFMKEIISLASSEMQIETTGVIISPQLQWLFPRRPPTPGQNVGKRSSYTLWGVGVGAASMENRGLGN